MDPIVHRTWLRRLLRRTYLIASTQIASETLASSQTEYVTLMDRGGAKMPNLTATSTALAAGIALALTGWTAVAASDGEYKDKTITMIIGSEPGGGTDAAGRLVANFLGQNMPGQPTVVVRNMPGASGMSALNYFVQQTPRDGLTVFSGSSSQVDPLTFRKSNAQYDPAALVYVGGVGRGGTVLLINAVAEKRLYDKLAAPVVMGSNTAVPRQGMQVTLWSIEYLGWNAKWVVGYPGTNEVMLALERGEIDMTSTGNLFQIQKYLSSGKFKILNQSGALENGKLVPRADFGNAPVFPPMLDGKIQDPLAQKAFDYWLCMNATDKWLALAPGTPDAIVTLYREAYARMSKNAEFSKQGNAMSEGFEPMSHQDVEQLVHTLVGIPDEALEYTKVLMRKQGLRIE